MTVMEMLRGGRPNDGAGPGASDVPRLRPVLVGVATAASSLLLVLAPVLLAWSVDGGAAGDVGAPVGTAAALWLLAQGAHLSAGSASISVVPLLLGALLVWTASRGLRRAVAGADLDEPHLAGLVPRPLASGALSWWAGYAGGVGGTAALTLLAPARPVWWTLAAPLVLVPGLAVAVVLTGLVRLDPDVLGPRLAAIPVPDLLRRAFGPALRGAALMLGIGMLVVLAAAAVQHSRVLGLHSATGAGLLGGVLLVAAQVAVLPNLGLWAVSFLSGPGFEAVEGARTTWSGSSEGLLPLLPVLGALPEPGRFPWPTPILVLVPVAVGAYIGQRSLATLARLSSLRAKARVGLSAAALAAALLGLLDVLAGGSVGAHRLSSVGAPAGWLTLALCGLFAVGALLAVTRDAWRLRR